MSGSVATARGGSVTVAMRGRRAPGLARRVGKSARRVLAVLGLPGAELSVLLVSDAEMRKLNRAYRGQDRATDVLSFSQLEGVGRVAGLLGDVVISVDTARRQAAERGERIGAEVDRLLVHGILHLLGWDHERSRAEADRMRRRERALARCLR